MEIHHLLEQHSIASKFIAELRDINIQKDQMRFRRNIERLGEILAFELSKSLTYKEKSITTPLGKAITYELNEQIVICSILRAGLPLHNGILSYFDTAENTFISAYRHHISEKEFEIKVEYLASPSLEGKTVILADPMLATGGSFVNVFEALKPMGTPAKIHLVSIIGARPGVDFVSRHFPRDTHLWIATIDEDLNDLGYIVPGLGDAGDLSYGTKLQH
ncbi:uracil phosphoribosyltransferase [Antarcticibacterium flavum]|uniref:Uracil phosphoribosyltransferase n=1 Tax=Antarcticibacterium flavum TaxID=2058175 RepID=A0A5B7X0H0_9FLAO|nr:MULTISPECIES: uracil phosphoribosyltransferase [Antarcticibacterium]MCM4158926.1 uracil phosphoribosyltransferase [Antarcticibacterium sp. W02-3]QCY68182.1 uracil phosphoribosyltransferase [Antarcticibacterium flavum]